MASRLLEAREGPALGGDGQNQPAQQIAEVAGQAAVGPGDCRWTSGMGPIRFTFRIENVGSSETTSGMVGMRDPVHGQDARRRAARSHSPSTMTTGGRVVTFIR